MTKLQPLAKSRSRLRRAPNTKPSRLNRTARLLRDLDKLILLWAEEDNVTVSHYIEQVLLDHAKGKLDND